MTERTFLIKDKIIVAESASQSHEIKTLVTKTLQDQFRILGAGDGHEVMELVNKNPDTKAIIMDLSLPQLDGIETARMLKRNFATLHIPVLIVTKKFFVDQMIDAVEFGADDYLLKPLDAETLKARVLMCINRMRRDQNTNPLTRLPGNNVIEKIIGQRIKQPLAILYCDLDNFKAYNDKYGFAKGDFVLKSCALLLSNTIRKYDSLKGFLGHLGGDDFIIVTSPKLANSIAREICTSFDKDAPKFYSEEDRLKGKIISKNRNGDISEFPLITISIAIVTNEKQQQLNMAQISQVAAHLKQYAKKKASDKVQSTYIKEEL